MVMLQPSVAESYLRDADMTSAPVHLSSVVEQVAQWQEYFVTSHKYDATHSPNSSLYYYDCFQKDKRAKPGNFKTNSSLPEFWQPWT